MKHQKLIIIGAGLLFTLACNALAQTTSTPSPIATVTPGVPPPTTVPLTATPVPAASESPVATDAAGDVALVQSFDGGRTWKQLRPTIVQ